MMFPFARTLAIAKVAAVLALLPCVAQTNQGGNAAPKPQSPGSGGQVIFSRSTDENGQTTTKTGPAAVSPAVQMATEPSVEDADRAAITYTNLDLDVRLHSAAHQIDVRALVTVRNDGKAPLTRIPL
jgi:hypothetical protein